MRTIFAGVFVCTGICLPVILFGDWLKHSSPAQALAFGVGDALFCVALCIVALFLFNTTFEKSTEFQTTEQYAKELEENGLLVPTDFRAIKSFEMPEFEDEGPHYFLELEDRSVLYLNGQYLYDYAPFVPPDFGPDTDLSSIFPCTDFTVRRHRDEGFVVDILCRGEALEPDRIGSPDDDGYLSLGEKWPGDGEILAQQTFNELKAHFEEKGN